MQPADNKIKIMTIREFTLAIGKSLLEGGEYVIYKGKDPYRYMNIRPVKVVRGGVTDEEQEERLKEAINVGKEKTLLGKE